MKRRLVLARALVNDPELIFLDEPTTGLDPQARHLMWNGCACCSRQGKTILLTTHFMDEAERLCDRLAIIDHGALIAEGTPHALIAEHIEPEVVEVYGEGVRGLVRAQGARSPAAPSCRRDGLLLPAGCRAARRDLAARAGACASCTGARTSRTSSSSSPAGRCANEPRRRGPIERSVTCACRLAALVRGLAPQLPRVAQARGRQHRGQHHRPALLPARAWASASALRAARSRA